jgi:hypothetical protein
MITKDRDYYRALRDAELLHEVDYGINVDWKELAIVLSERLDIARDCDCY